MGEVKFEVTGLREMENDFDRAGSPMGHKQLMGLNSQFEIIYRAVRTRTHVDTGYLRLSGRRDTHYNGNIWEGTIEFARHPGVYELARGDAPSRSHPEGGHNFFDATDAHIPALEEEIDIAIKDFFGGRPV